MAYSTGTASTMAEVLTALTNACTADGWIWDSVNETLYKSGCYVRLQSFEAVDVDPRLELLGRTSVDGGDGGDAPRVVSMRTLGAGSYAVAISFPVSYYIFTFAAEVFLVLKYSDRHQWLAFGQSQQNGLPGTGNWVAATAGSEDQNTDIYDKIFIGAGSGNLFSNRTSAAFAWNCELSTTSFYSQSFFLHSNLDTVPWALGADSVGANHTGPKYITELIASQPNEITGESVLLPIRAYKNRPSSKISQVLEVENARHIRVDNYTSGQILTLGTDQWMVFPWYAKNIDARNGGAGSHTGTFGWAIRYEGP